MAREALLRLQIWPVKGRQRWSEVLYACESIDADS